VPNVVGRRQSEAVAALRSAGLEATVREANINGDRGTVAQQEPEPGEPLRPGASVVLTVATGRVQVPDVADKRESEALRVLYDAGFKVPTIRSERHRTVPEGLAIRTDPEAGKVLERGAEVHLYVSRGFRD
jgi:beta-lactam-binding protein with PASTA domain